MEVRTSERRQNNRIEGDWKKIRGAASENQTHAPGLKGSNYRRLRPMPEPKNQAAAKREVILANSEEMRVHIIRVQANRDPRCHLDVHAAAANKPELER